MIVVASCAVLYRRDCGGEIKQNMPWATYATALYGKEWGMQTGGARKREMDAQRVVAKGGGTRKETLALKIVELAREATTSVGLLSSIHPKRTGILIVHASSFAILLASIPSFVMHTESGLFGFS